MEGKKVAENVAVGYSGGTEEAPDSPADSGTGSLPDDRNLATAEDVAKMKSGTMIIDVSCDPHLGIETSHETTIADPVYIIDGVIHYAVDNTPAMYPITVTKVLSEGFAPYVDKIIENNYPKSLENAVVIRDGHIIDQRIREFREARGLYCR